MTGLWLVSFIVLWVLVVAEGLVILALAREVESLHGRQEAQEQHVRLLDLQARGKGASTSDAEA